MGGAVALDFAIRYPKKVDSLVLMSCFYKADKNLRNTLCQFKNALDVSFEEFYDIILPMVLCPDVIDDNKNELELLKEIGAQNANTEAYINAVDVCLNLNIEKHLSKINIPTLILTSRYDDIAPLDMQKNLHAQIKNSKLIVFDNVKHNLLVGENNEKILAILKDNYK